MKLDAIKIKKMLLDFSVGNFRSFKSIESITMLAQSQKENSNDPRITKVGKHHILKTKSIYGSNGSGKSNLAKAILAFWHTITSSGKIDGALAQSMHPFILNEKNPKEPCFFQMTYYHEGITYRYGFEADRDKIFSEWLFGTKQREVCYFLRNNLDIEIKSNNFSDGLKFLNVFGKNKHVIKSNSLFLSTLIDSGSPQAMLVSKFFQNFYIVTGLQDSTLMAYSSLRMEQEDDAKRIIDFIRKADLQIDTLGFEYQKDGRKRLLSRHIVFDEQNKPSNKKIAMDFIDTQSEGTKKMFEIAPLIIDAVNKNTVLVIDEFDARLHPKLTLELIETLHSTKNKAGQLIYMTHDTNLLDPEIQRKDQITFVEKDSVASSHIYSLAEIKGVRSDLYARDYLLGKFGAIPILDDYEAIIQ